MWPHGTTAMKQQDLQRETRKIVQKRVREDPVFRKELLREAVETLISGDLDAGKVNLRAFINATVGFPRLGDLTRVPDKSLMRMLGPHGNPHARKLLQIVRCLQELEGVRFEIRPAPNSSNAKYRPALNTNDRVWQTTSVRE